MISSILSRFYRRWLPWLLSPLLTLALYWRTLPLPLFWDDAANFDFATTRTFLQIWTDVSGFPYYRPVLFTFWKMALAVLPFTPALLFRALVLAVHAVNGILVGRLAQRFIPDRATPAALDESAAGFASAHLAGLFATAFFAVYPFAAVPLSHVAAFFHPTVTLATLGATLAALKFTSEHKRRWLAGTLLLTFLAPYCHEAGVVAGAVVALALIIRHPRSAWRLKWLLGVLPLLSALFLPVWLAVPKSRDPFHWPGPEGIFAATAFFSQGLTYPTQLLTRPLINWLKWWDVAAIWVVTGLALLVVALLLRRDRQWQPLALSLGWAGLTMLPSVVTLSMDYIVVSPRLLYYLGPSAAILWAAACRAAVARVRRPITRVGLSLGLAALVGVPPIVFIQREVALHEWALRPLQDLVAITRAYPGERPLLINGTNWLNYSRPWYALGHEGVTVMASYLDFNDLLRLNHADHPQFTMATFPPVKEAMDQHFASTLNEHIPWDWATLAQQAAAYDRVWLTSYSDREIRTLDVGSVRNGQARAPAAYLASFEAQLYLTGAAYRIEQNEAIITLQWKYLGSDPAATIFRHVFDCAGNVLGLGDGHALGRMLPFGYLLPGAEVRDVRHVPLNATAPDGCYSLEVGLFYPDGSRMRAFAPDGTEIENAVVTVR